MSQNIFKSRYTVQYNFILFFLGTSFLMRLFFICLSCNKAAFSPLDVLQIIAKGSVFDLGVSMYFCIIYSIYLLILPQKWNNSKFNKVFSYGIVFLMIMISVFSFFAEYTFWKEFESRFNFIAVDYLVYTYEVIHNINESYPLPLLIGTVILISIFLIWINRTSFNKSFKSNTQALDRLSQTTILLLVASVFAFNIDNSWAEKNNNRYKNELSKAGIYSFFSAFINNEINYDQFYTLIDNQNAFKILKNDLYQSGAVYGSDKLKITRNILSGREALQPNVIMVVLESFSAEYMGEFGNKDQLTPVLDSISKQSVIFKSMYATGTRTVRGMEALSLAVPPTPGNSIVRRKNNDHLTTIGNIFRSKGYSSTFFYGGDGYFDNMNQYFGNNGFDIVDRGRRLAMGDKYQTKRTIVPDSEVTFENAWGMCDEDLFKAVLTDADIKSGTKKPFYNFVMTTSNHRPYTYPDAKIDIPSGTGREGAIKYTDYAIGKFLQQASSKPWFKNTVFIFVADHCAGSAGKNEIDISKYLIPAIIYNVPGQAPKEIDQMCSQIDLYPTFFSLLQWSYTSNNYGKNVLDTGYIPRILVGTYQKLAYMKKDQLIILGPKREIESYSYNTATNDQKVQTPDKKICNEAISYYQTAYYLFKNGGLKQ